MSENKTARSRLRERAACEYQKLLLGLSFLGLFLLGFDFAAALFTNFLGLGRFHAAFVIAFLAGLLGLFAATSRGIGLARNAHPREGAGENCQQFNGLHFFGLSINWCLARLHNPLANRAAN
jgi:hypothetical protein